MPVEESEVLASIRTIVQHTRDEVEGIQKEARQRIAEVLIEERRKLDAELTKLGLASGERERQLQSYDQQIRRLGAGQLLLPGG
ncbi:MAG: hypothetical protein H6760_03530 [Candidatus Nomurabacteria bacterium]|nr:MAG: hypothetical protein H6760_03530 [Candidatus Nomurabacteria bacterium]